MLQLNPWPLGVSLSDPDHPEALIYFRFYEWHLFDAVRRGDHTHGIDDWPWTIADDGRRAAIRSDWLTLAVQVVDDGAELALSVTNRSDYDWPDIAAIIPCLGAEYNRHGLRPSAAFFDDDHERTYYLGPDGLTPLAEREIHYAAEWLPAVRARSAAGDGVFPDISHNWPHSDEPAAGGLMVRAAADGRWVTGVAWADYLSAQGHNPRRCMHLSVRVGPLAQGASKAVRGKLYLFPGTAADGLAHYRRDFANDRGETNPLEASR
jgi:hypothetical protein